MGSRLASDRRGGSLVEYLILLGLVGIVAMAGFKAFGATVDRKASCLADAVAGNGAAGCAEATAAAARGALGGAKNPPFDVGDATKGAKYEDVPGKAVVTGPGDTSGVDPDDVSQGQLGDCYLISSMAAIAARDPHALEKIIHQNKDGSYTVTFQEKNDHPFWQFWESDWKEKKITVTGQFPVKDGQPVFAQPGDPTKSGQELWPMIIEKAYAQYRGGYPEIGKGGWMDGPLELMTGEGSKGYDQNVSWDDLETSWKNGDAMTAGTLGEDDAKNNPLYQDGGPLETPLVADHAYYVVGVDSANHTVTLKNPWGWGDGTFTLTYDQYKSAFTRTVTNPID